MNDAEQVVFRDEIAAGIAQGFLQFFILFDVETFRLVFPGPACGEDRFQMPTADLAADCKRCNLALFLDLPFNILFDIRVVDVQGDHFGCPTRGAARLDSPGGAVANFEEAHQA